MAKAKKVEEHPYEGTGYCVKCKASKKFVGKAGVAANGTWIAKGPCETCNTTVCRMLGKNWVPGLIPASQVLEQASSSGKVLNAARGAGKVNAQKKSRPKPIEEDDDDMEEF